MNHLDKIKKLLKLSRSATANEAEVALAKAMELAARHEIDLSTLGSDNEVGDIIHQFFPTKARLAREWMSALNIAQNYFSVSVCIMRSRQQVLFVGRQDAIDIADYIVSFLVREVRRQVKDFGELEKKMRRKMTGGKRAAFVAGFFTGIGQKLQEGRFDLMREDNRYALVLSTEDKRREEAMSGIVGKTKTVIQKKPRRSAATIAGYLSGRATNLARPLPGKAATQGQLALN
jgi:hypothetical protein